MIHIHSEKKNVHQSLLQSIPANGFSFLHSKTILVYGVAKLDMEKTWLRGDNLPLSAFRSSEED